MNRDADQTRLGAMRAYRFPVKALTWEEFTAAAVATSWVTYLGTIDRSGRPDLSVVAPGFTPGSV
jgi:hypothetical protein